MALLPLTSVGNADVSPTGTAYATRALMTRAISAVGRRGAFLRRAGTRLPLISQVSDRRYEKRLSQHAGHLPLPSAAQLDVLAELNDAGVAVRPAELPADVVDSADGLVTLLRRKGVDAPCVKATPRELAVDPTLFTWGLSDHLLDLAECHIGLPVRYLGMEVKRELVRSASGGNHEVVRRWHLDHEDRRIFKVIVYLSDVDAGAGPFGYIHQSHSSKIRGSRRLDVRGVPDDDMHAMVPRHEWAQVTGPRMTAVLVDTGQVFHRVFPPTDTERYSVTFAYSSRSPYYAYSRLMLPRRAVDQLRERLSPRQWDALCVGRGRRAGVA
ncbi:hypothetical protein H7J06_12265 [Mycobacterium hodleri]|uniref:hypothetical protein n=1 Tax=Mycolicibacterium hodleri TaxID=49897 RepID=UPI0021F2B202|nr:hypothetical protein [Mycolicibacterium hodleri]MCV7133763.1 hypothetical protein [Mycolicibacterium hodleri]